MCPAYLSLQSILLVSTKCNRAETSLFIAVIDAGVTQILELSPFLFCSQPFPGYL